MRRALVFNVAALALVASLAVPSGELSADPTYSGSPLCSAAYVGFSPTPYACSGAWIGNDNDATWVENQIATEGWGTGWTYEGKNEEDGTGPFETFTGNPTSGTLTFLAPFTGSFVLILKSSTKFSMYYFKDVIGLEDVDFSTAGTSLSPAGAPQGLSHASLWTKGGTVVPEPSTVILLATGLLGLGIVGYRRRDEV